MGLFDILKSGLFGLGGGPNDPRLSGAQNAQAARGGLVTAGLATIANADKPGFAPAAMGLMAGREAGGMQRQGILQQDQAAQMAELFKGKEVDISLLQNAFGQALASGNTEMARSLSEVLKASISATGMNYNLQREWIPTAGDPSQEELWNVDPRTGQKVGTAPLGARPRAVPGAAMAGTREMQIRDDYRAEITPIRDAYRFIDSALGDRQKAIAGDPAARTAMLYAFIKALDPNSVVREGEVRLTQEAQSIWQRAQALYEEVVQGKSPIVPTEMVGNMVSFMERMQGEKETAWQESYDNMNEYSEANGLKPMLQVPPTTYRSRQQSAASSPVNRLRALGATP